MTTAKIIFLSTLLTFLASKCGAFVLSPGRSCFFPKTALSLIQSKFFQLEEMEDKETCTTEVFLSKDNTVAVGETNGPLFVDAAGTWEESTNGSFKMTVTRKYGSGQPGTDMGEFSFDVERSFIGELSETGGKTSVTGSVNSFDDVMGERKVGYFSMIDTTNDRLGDEEE
uniref:Jacalin-type lectin domain-containing protein n=1 Tax=Eucampia antarctica TaxID=49252 RepID=A0A7S2RNG6_9STRA|mmetsp:Transcript_24663/g.23684  ORF Transcript_24663/g.23684 Transcript_24663/m.23684 type:complete len:170 (+) Transcript_24663:40-549(+)